MSNSENGSPSRVHSITMTVAEWAQVPDNPRQRDTESHVKRARHLLRASPAQARVSMAEMPNGRRFKIDGHSRVYVWTVLGLGFPPPLLYVDVYPVASPAEAAALYGHFDAMGAAETSGDKVSGSFHEVGWYPSSEAMSGAKIGNAIKYADTYWKGYRSALYTRQMQDEGFNVYAAVTNWLSELRALDNLNPLRKKFPGPIMSAALMSIRKYGSRAQEFWDLYNRDAGTKLNNAIDPVEALSRMVLATKFGGSATSYLSHTGRALAAVEAHLENRTYMNGLTKGLNPSIYNPTPQSKEGSIRRSLKVTKERALAIRALKGQLLPTQIAAKFHLSRSVVYNILSNSGPYAEL